MTPELAGGREILVVREILHARVAEVRVEAGGDGHDGRAALQGLHPDQFQHARQQIGPLLLILRKDEMRLDGDAPVDIFQNDPVVRVV